MKLTNIIIILFSSMVLSQSCSTTKNNIYWVSGTKTECSAGAGKMKCLHIHKGKDLTDASWENFYAEIEGFEFEEGYLKKIKVKEEKLDEAKVPADGSSIKYKMVKELEKKLDNRTLVEGKWTLTRINAGPINRSIVLPNMEVNLSQMSIVGSGGCNRYSGSIEKLSPNSIKLGNIVSTEKACLNRNIESDYYQAINKVNTYEIKGTDLVFYDEEGKEILSYMKQAESAVNQRLHDIWITSHIDGKPIDRKGNNPNLEINLTDMRVLGNDNCNNFSASIKEVTGSKLVLGPIASTKKMCPEMEITDKFNQALNKVASFKLDGLVLTLMDINGKPVLAFFKGD